ncbi:MAG: universal stress protein [Oligoflexia bacterium]|nr:universal stress protein [Oligoflexia bacterium]
MASPEKKIIWAVDPFAEEKTLQRSVGWAIKSITAGQLATIQPVYFFSAYIMDGPPGISDELFSEIKAAGQKAFDRIVKPIKLNPDGLRPLHVIAESNIPLREGVDRVTHMAKEWGADMVATGTRARKGLKHLWLGSFAETLVLYSDVPIFLVNPRWRKSSALKHILFPTDFSEESREAFHQVLPLAGSLGAKVTLLHKMSSGWIPVVDVAESVNTLYNDVFKKQIDWVQSRITQWEQEAKSAGVVVDSVMDRRPSGSIVDSILAHAKRRPGMIAMTAHSGFAKTVLLGSTTRKVLRSSPYPVWILHPRPKAAEQAGTTPKAA